MGTLVTVYICESQSFDKLLQIFSKSLNTEPEEVKVLEFMRKAILSHSYESKLLAIRSVDKLLGSRYCESRVAIQLLRESLRKMSDKHFILMEVNKLRWLPAKTSEVTINGFKMPVADIDIEGTMQLQRDYDVKGFVKVRI